MEVLFQFYYAKQMQGNTVGKEIVISLSNNDSNVNNDNSLYLSGCLLCP